MVKKKKKNYIKYQARQIQSSEMWGLVWQPHWERGSRSAVHLSGQHVSHPGDFSPLQSSIVYTFSY